VAISWTEGIFIAVQSMAESVSWGYRQFEEILVGWIMSTFTRKLSSYDVCSVAVL